MIYISHAYTRCFAALNNTCNTWHAPLTLTTTRVNTRVTTRSLTSPQTLATTIKVKRMCYIQDTPQVQDTIVTVSTIYKVA